MTPLMKRKFLQQFDHNGSNFTTHKSVIVRKCVCVVLILVTYITPFLITHFSYYIPAKQWNDNVVVTNGQVVKYNTYKYITKYSCNCVRTCIGHNHHCTTKCDVCTRPCYSGEIIISYDTVDNIVNETKSIYTANMIQDGCYYDLQYIKNKIQSTYPIGHNITIYYNKNNPVQYRFEITPTYRTAEICSICIPFGIIMLNIIAIVIMNVYRKLKCDKTDVEMAQVKK